MPEGTKPPLTPEMVAADKATGSSPPGAGGWTPKQIQVAVVSSLAAGATAALDLASSPEGVTPKAMAIAAVKAAIIYFVAHFGMLSAGVRKTPDE